MSNTNENGLLSPIQFAALIAPGKPPQYAYQLLKQGLPHQIIHTKDAQGKPKQKPMIDPVIATQWYNDFILTKAPRRSRNEDGTSTSTSTNANANANAGTPGGQNTGSAGQKRSAYQKGQLLTYQRVPGIVTLAQIRAEDPAVVLYTTVHGDLSIDTRYTYPFLPETLREKILGRKIILDNPRRVIQYVIDSLTSLPVQDNDAQLAEELHTLLQKYPQQKKQPAEQSQLEKDLDDAPIGNPTDPSDIATNEDTGLDAEEDINSDEEEEPNDAE